MVKGTEGSTFLSVDREESSYFRSDIKKNFFFNYRAKNAIKA